MAGYVVYFTRSGTSKRIAENIASKLDFEIVEIKDTMNWKGIIGYIKAGYYTVKNKPVTITLSKVIEKDLPMIVVSPLWAGGAAQPVRIFLKDLDPSNVSVIINSLGTISNKLENRNKYAYVGDIVKKTQNESEIIAEIVNRFK